MPDYWVHPNALVETTALGPGTRVWAFAHILRGAVVGADCNICDHVFIENDVKIGNRVTIKCGVQLWDGLEVEDDVFLGPNATFSNDPFPRSRRQPAEFTRTRIERGASIGANATILPGVVIGRDSMVGAGSVVTHNVPPRAIVSGNPAAIRGYVDARAESRLKGEGTPLARRAATGARLIELRRFEDLRGQLVVAEAGSEMPFSPQRVFFVSAVPSREVRGEHAHRSLQQLLICCAGECRVVADDGRTREEFHLDAPTMGLLVPPRVWTVQYRFSADAVLAVLASDAYDPADYVRSYEEFQQLAGVSE